MIIEPASRTLSRINAVRASRADFADLVRTAGLDPRMDFVRANLRGVNFGASDLAGFNFAQADLTGADMRRATGKDRLTLTDAITTGALGLPEPWEHQEGPAPAMVRIPAGRFRMGATARENKREKVLAEWAKWSSPQRDMTIARPFWLAKHAVTRGQFAAFVAATGHEVPKGAWTYEPDEKGTWDYRQRDDRDWRNPGFEQTDDHPVVCVSHHDAMAYIDWLNRSTRGGFRLPTEAEWEYACRAGTTTARFWGEGREQAHRFANVCDTAFRDVTGAAFDAARHFPGDDLFPYTASAGSFLPNPFGLYDTLGNVWEWCADIWTDDLKTLPQDGSSNTTGDSSHRPVRGGSWDDDPRDVRAAGRDWGDAGGRSANTGFRVARTSLTS